MSKHESESIWEEAARLRRAVRRWQYAYIDLKQELHQVTRQRDEARRIVM